MTQVSFDAADKSAKSSRISNKLLDLHQELINDENSKDSKPKVDLSNPDILIFDLSGTSIMVRITATDVESLLPALSELGFKIIGSASNSKSIEGWMPIASVAQVETLESEGYIGIIPVYKPANKPSLIDELNNIKITASDTNQEPIVNSTPTFSTKNKSLLQLDDSGTRVIVRITAIDVEKILPDLIDLGFELIGSAPDFNFVEGWISIGEVPQLEALQNKGIMGVLPVYKPITNKGLANNQADFVQEANRVRASLPASYDGTGVRVGAMSDSYNVSGDGSAEADIASGDLPGGVTVLQEGPNGSSDEGRAMLQLVHDIAPGSSLAFSSVFLGELNFAQQILDLADPSKGNAQVLVDDVIYFTEPFFQDGVVAKAVDDVVTNRGVTYFSSAGNQARQAYESKNFNASLDSLRSGTFHDFDPSAGVDTRQNITLQPGQTITLSFQWNDPFYTTDGVKTDLDLYLVRSGTNTLLARADDFNITTQTPYEILSYTNSGLTALQADLMIQRYAGPSPGRIKYVNFGDANIFNEYVTNSSTIFGHAAAVNAKAVGAVNYFEQQNSASFSSVGPTEILFDANGTRKVTPEVRLKPDFAAIQGTDTTFFGSDVDGNGFPNFFGTSAAAPNAAAIAALVKQANPTFTPAQIYSRLESTATDIGAAGRDDLTGVGLINAYDAVFGSVVPASLNFSDNFEDGDLPLAYETRTTGAGRIQVTTTNSPIGSRHLTLDSSFNGVSSLNEAILHVNTTDFTNVQLSFAQKEFSDDDNIMPASFVGSSNSDGVALSVDGTNWLRLTSLTGSNSTAAYQTQTFNLSTFAANNGVTLGSDVRIKFQQFGTSTIANDGFAFDNLSVTGTTIINGTPDRDTLIGTSGDDIITGFAGRDTITTGAGNDQLVYTSVRDTSDIILDFSVGSDKIVLTQLLDSIVPVGYNRANAIADGYIQLGSRGTNTLVLIDPDGNATNSPARVLLVAQGVTLTALNNPNNFVF
jgi:Subtilase family/RTX calcium-binding nonapeptide repeat (4 copies)